VRIVMAVEPRAYREVIGNALQELRPHAEVVILEPDGVDQALARLDPDLVICDGCVSSNPNGRAAWVEYHPFEEPPGMVSLDGDHTELEELNLEDLLWVVDKVDELLSRSRTDLRRSR
jgi:hypothetical protein